VAGARGGRPLLRPDKGCSWARQGGECRHLAGRPQRCAQRTTDRTSFASLAIPIFFRPQKHRRLQHASGPASPRIAAPPRCPWFSQRTLESPNDRTPPPAPLRDAPERCPRLAYPPATGPFCLFSSAPFQSSHSRQMRPMSPTPLHPYNHQVSP
jgi:hypothetical protein